MNEQIECLERLVIRPDGTRKTGERPLLKEHRLSIIVNEKLLLRLICTKDHLRELVVGRLFSEGLIRTRSEILQICFSGNEREARISLGGDIRRERGTEFCAENPADAGGQGRCVLQKLSPVIWQPKWIFKLTEAFSEGMKLHNLTQATHSCFLAKGDRLLFSCEEIGRHNAVDKAIGYGMMQSEAFSECILFTSGRVPVDMVQKVILAGVPILVSKSVPTAESVEMAKQYGLTLICCAFPDQIEVY